MRFQVNLDRRVDDKSHSYLRKRGQEQKDPFWENYYTKRARQFSNGFSDDWDTTDYRQLNEFGEMPEEFLARRTREREAFKKLLELEDALEDERPCKCIGPCIYPQGALHPTQKEKDLFATALKPAPVQPRLSRQELDQREFARRHQRKLNAGAGLKQFRSPDPVGQQIGYVLGARKH